MVVVGFVLSPTLAFAQEQESAPPPPADAERDAEIFGADDSRDAEMFGAPPETNVAPPAQIDASPPAPAPEEGERPDIFDASAKDRETDLFGADETPGGPGVMEQLASSLGEIDDWTQIGGLLYLRLSYQSSPLRYGVAQVPSDLEDPDGPTRLGAGEDQYFSSPNLLDFYLDARPTDRIRGYVRGRFRYDFTVRSDTRVFGQPVESESIALDQLWLKFDVLQFAYLTIGQQPIRWGSGRFWNPTDFLNRQARDSLAILDERLGVNLVKVHIPVESLGWNFYVVANLDDLTNFDEIGAAARAEFLIGETEIALSGAYRKDNPGRVGLDITSAIWWFDVRLEMAAQYDVQTPYWSGDFVIDLENFVFEQPTRRSRADQVILQGVAGAEIGIPYNDENDNLILGAEYFYNDAGYGSSRLYPWLLSQGQFNPLTIGRHYVAAYATLFAPGDWDDASFILSWIGNLSDLSNVIRFDTSITVLTRLSLNAYASVYFGEEGGAFRFKQDPVNLRVYDWEDVVEPNLASAGLTEETAAALERGQRAPLFEAGIGARISF